MFIESVMKITGYLEYKEGHSIAWVVSCRAVSEKLELRTK